MQPSTKVRVHCTTHAQNRIGHWWMQYFLSMVMPTPSVGRKTYIFTEISKEDMKLKKNGI